MVSIIIPNFNHANFIEQRIQSVLNQSYQNFELILLDDCSSDQSISILKKYESNTKVKGFIVNHKNSGSPFKQWFKGIEKAKGDFIWIAESDDYSSLYFLEKVMARFKENEKLDVVFTGTTNVDEQNNNIGNTTRIERKNVELLSKDFVSPGLEFLHHFLPDYCIIRNVSSSVFKKSVISPLLERVVTFKTIGDFYFWIVLCLENRNFGYISEKLNFMRNHKNNVRNNINTKPIKTKEYQRIHKLVLYRQMFNLTIARQILKYHLRKHLIKLQVS